MRIAVAALAITLAACGGKHPGSYTQQTAEMSAEQSALAAKIAEADAHWAARVEDARLAAALTAYEEALALAPDNRHALEHLVRGWYFYGDAFTEEKELKIERWAKAIEFGARCLALNDDFRARIEAGEKERDAVAAATATDVHCLYWTASALGKWGKIQGLSKTLKHLPTVKAYIGKVEELNPTFWHYGPARYWGAYYAVLPSFAGRDLDLSAQYFTASIEGAPTYLGTRVLRAENLAVATEDIALFDSDLAAVLDANVDPSSEFGPENVKEQEKARALQAQRPELFTASAIEGAGAAQE
jgi:tetratricopeptide (TPR) repeat protein